jgi:ribonuclease P protein component
VGARGRDVVVVVHARATEGGARLGIVASRRVGPAVARNRAKRLVREWFRRRKDAVPSVDVIVVLREGAPRRSAAELARDLEATLARALAKAAASLDDGPAAG